MTTHAGSDVAAPEPELRPVPTGWFALSHEYPRIGVTAETEEDAVAKFASSRAAWLALDEEWSSTSFASSGG